MWKPTNVVAKDRQRATLVWGGLILAAIAYTAWQIVVMVLKRRNPSTSISISNDNFLFPSITVCFEHQYGCGFADGSTEACVETAMSYSWAYTESSSSSTSTSTSTAYSAGYPSVRPQESVHPECLEFDLSRFELASDERNLKPQATMIMTWVSSDNSTAETDYSTSVQIIVGGEDDEVEYTAVPYSRNEKPATDEQYHETAMTIGKTHRKYLSKEPTTNYPVLTLSTTSHVTTKLSEFLPSSSTSDTYYQNHVPSLTDNYAIGSLVLTITQGSYSLTEISDIDPLEIGSLLGNIGGFWELLVLTWGICFIANSRGSEPTMKGRNFSKALKRGSSKVIRRKRKLDPAAPPTDREEERPHWDNICISSDSEAGESERRGRVHPEASIRANGRPPVAQPLPKRARESPGNKVNRVSVATHRSSQSSGAAVERNFARRVSGDNYTPTRWADMPRGTFSSTGGTRIDVSGTMTTTGTRAPTPPASVGAVPKQYPGELVVARSGFFARRSPSADSLGAHSDGEPEAEEISDIHDSFDDRATVKTESLKCQDQDYGVCVDGDDGDIESSQGTVASSNDTTVAPARHWAMPADSPMMSNGYPAVRGTGFAPTSMSFKDATV